MVECGRFIPVGETYYWRDDTSAQWVELRMNTSPWNQYCKSKPLSNREKRAMCRECAVKAGVVW